MVLCRELRFFVLHSAHQNPSFELSKSTFWQFFRFFTLIEDPYEFGVVKSYTDWIKWLKKFPKKSEKNWTKWIRKMGGRCFIITSGAFGGTLLYCSPSCNILHCTRLYTVCSVLYCALKGFLLCGHTPSSGLHNAFHSTLPNCSMLYCT